MSNESKPPSSELGDLILQRSFPEAKRGSVADLYAPPLPAPHAPAGRTDALRGLSRLTGQEPEAVAEALRRGGPLAGIVRNILGRPTARRGRPPDDLEMWRRFAFVVQELRRDTASPKRGAVTRAMDAACARLCEGELQPPNLVDEVKRTFYRVQKAAASGGRGWRFEDVPEGADIGFPPGHGEP